MGQSLRVLILHNRYQHAGGEDTLVAQEKSLLEGQGHPVELLEANNDGIIDGWSKAKAAMSAIYSPSSKRWVSDTIARFRPDVVHVHNFFPMLSPSVYMACREAGVPVVQALHNYRIACPNALFFREGRVCEDCLGKAVPWPGIKHGCYRGSQAQSAAVAAMISLHRWGGTWREGVDAYIAHTTFQQEKLVAAGLPIDRIQIKPNFVFDPGPRPQVPGSYALYIGRLSAEKGLDTLIEAYRTNEIPLPLKIVGVGPLREQLEAMVRGSQAEGLVEFLGWQDNASVRRLVSGALIGVFPSACFEVFPMTLIEMFSSGMPVVASRIGGIPEIVRDGETGWLATPGDVRAWAEAIARASSDPEDCLRRGREARKAYEERFSPEAVYQRLMDIYHRVLPDAERRHSWSP